MKRLSPFLPALPGDRRTFKSTIIVLLRQACYVNRWQRSHFGRPFVPRSAILSLDVVSLRALLVVRGTPCDSKRTEWTTVDALAVGVLSFLREHI